MKSENNNSLLIDVVAEREMDRSLKKYEEMKRRII